MTRRRIRGVLLAAGVVGGIKILRDLAMSRNRRRSPEIVEGIAAAAPVRPTGR